MKEDTLFRTMLFDFYGEMLTGKQREYFDLHYNEDLSLAEIAEQNGISRQGVWDIIKRAENSMRGIEQKTGLMRRFSERRAVMSELDAELEALCRLTTGDAKKCAESALSKLRSIEE